MRTVHEKYRGGDVFNLYPLGDIHRGSINCDTKLLKDTIRRIELDPQARWCGMGDYMDLIPRDDRRWSSEEIDPDFLDIKNVDELADRHVEDLTGLLRPITDKCWFMLSGNHEHKFSTKYHSNILKRVVHRLGKPALLSDWSIMLRVIFSNHGRRRTWNIFAEHGWQAGRSEGAKVNQARQVMSYITADLYLVGHSHSSFCHPFTRYEVDSHYKRLIEKKVWFAHTGSFLHSRSTATSTYAERGGYPPTPLGPIRIQYAPKKDGYQVEVSQYAQG